MVRRIPKCHVIEPHISFEFLICDRAVRLMRMLPCPQSGTLPALCKIALYILFRIDKSNVSVVNLRILIHHIKDTLGTRQRHNDGIELLRDLHERLSKALRKLQIRSDHTKRHVSDSHNGKKSSQNSRKYKLQIAQVSDDRAHDTCKCMRI